jgi:hypothetical protein
MVIIHSVYFVDIDGTVAESSILVNLLTPNDYWKHQQFNIHKFYILPTLYLCVLYLYYSKQRL